jgi:hypothetical protein
MLVLRALALEILCAKFAVISYAPLCTENPRVGGSIPPLATTFSSHKVR